MIFLTLNANARNKDIRNFDKFINDGKNVFVMFHMNGCTHCIQALPEWQNIKNKINNKLKNNNNIIIADIESSNLTQIKNSQNIEGFPTIRYIHNYGKSYEDYNGERAVSEFIKWIESKTTNNSSVVATYKGGKKNKNKKTKKQLQTQDNNVDFDFDLFIQKLFIRKK